MLLYLFYHLAVALRAHSMRELCIRAAGDKKIHLFPLLRIHLHLPAVAADLEHSRQDTAMLHVGISDIDETHHNDSSGENRGTNGIRRAWRAAVDEIGKIQHFIDPYKADQHEEDRRLPESDVM